MDGRRDGFFLVPTGDDDCCRRIIREFGAFWFLLEVFALLKKGNEKKHFEVKGYKKEDIEDAVE